MSLLHTSNIRRYGGNAHRRLILLLLVAVTVFPPSTALNIGQLFNRQNNAGAATEEVFIKAADLLAPPDPEEVMSTAKKLRLKDTIPLLEQWEEVARTLPATIKSILLYKPPVGITAVFVTFRVIFRGSGKVKTPLDTIRGGGADGTISKRNIIRRRRKKHRRTGRALDLDYGDRSYDETGGVESIRTELCKCALQNVLGYVDDNISEQGLENSSSALVMAKEASAALEALEISCPPHGSREEFVESMIVPLSQLRRVLRMTDAAVKNANTSKEDKNQKGSKRLSGDGNSNEYGDLSSIVMNDENSFRIIQKAAKVAEIRTLDALLRMLRDRLLVTASRLAKTERYWKWRVQWYNLGSFRSQVSFARRFFDGSTLESDRQILAVTSAEYQKEIKRLGQVQWALQDRPFEMDSSALLEAASTNSSFWSANNKNDDTDNYSGVSTGESIFSSQRAVRVLIGEDFDNKPVDKGIGFYEISTTSTSDWVIEAHSWTSRTRHLLCDIVGETMSGLAPTEQSSPSPVRNVTVEKDMRTLREWCAYYSGRGEQGESAVLNHWQSILFLVDDIAESKRMGERRRYPTIPDITAWYRHIDFRGVPSALVSVGLAMVVHNTVKPHWPDIVEFTRKTFGVVQGIYMKRFYEPIKDIVLELLNRKPKLLEPFNLRNEETSLDNMLFDLGVGDGTVKSRTEAIAGASRLYEEELRKGALKGLLRGRTVRLLLIQIQTLKTGLLQAMGSIDNLIDANRLNVQLLASIPAVLLFAFGSRLLFQSLYSLRSRDLRPTQSVHRKMTEYLNRIETILLLSSYEIDSAVATASMSIEPKSSASSQNILPPTSDVVSVLTPAELGEFVLLAHTYLLMLDYCSPPFPMRTCDSIHRSMQNMLLQGHLSTRRQRNLLQLIRAKHDALV